MSFHNDLLWQLLFQFFIALVLVFATVGFAAGVGLIITSGPTLRVLQALNRWVSTRGAFKALDTPRNTEQFSHRNRRWVGGSLMAGGIFAAFGLVASVDPAAVGRTFARGDMATVVAIAAGTVRWLLVIGSIAGVAVGFMLFFLPNALATLEKYANRWFSPRQTLRGGDEMRLDLDKLIAAHPGPSGWILACTTLGAAIYAAVLLLARQ
jgi:hypothetical protein